MRRTKQSSVIVTSALQEKQEAQEKQPVLRGPLGSLSSSPLHDHLWHLG
jgi:hypothetical protein